jgi:iron complex outermembrane recepter protein
VQAQNLGAPVWVACALLGANTVGAATDVQALKDLSIEELSNIEITSVSKRDERLSDAPTSVFVITSEDIRRSGATSLPEALRLAPNLQVARVSANEYAISARGFNGTAANKLLVLIDGRSVYSPLFSGVFWDVQDVMIEDIERIEVISGSGGTLWGVNAVNGVINVITRSASQSQGGLAVAGGGHAGEKRRIPKAVMSCVNPSTVFLARLSAPSVYHFDFKLMSQKNPEDYSMGDQQ